LLGKYDRGRKKIGGIVVGEVADKDHTASRISCGEQGMTVSSKEDRVGAG